MLSVFSPGFQPIILRSHRTQSNPSRLGLTCPGKRGAYSPCFTDGETETPRWEVAGPTSQQVKGLGMQAPMAGVREMEKS